MYVKIDKRSLGKLQWMKGKSKHLASFEKKRPEILDTR